MKKTMAGRVVSDAMEKTVVVQVEQVYVHPLYEKRLKRKKKHLAHDELGAKLGDTVTIEQTRPISKRKRWQVTRILSHATT